MGCDARIVDKNKPVKLKAVCGTCGLDVNLDRPDIYHKNCFSHVDGYDLDIYFDWENIERR